ncbi:MAG: CvpA family protein [Bacteroidales bacterium]|nr:CvpA family protein [Bacteroidales bacterium]
MDLNFLDLIIGVPVLLMAISGFRNGFIKELASLAALVLGLYFAIYFSDLVADWLLKYFDIGHRWLFIVAFILTFVVVVLVVSLIGNLLSKIAALAALGFLNRFIGMLFGILKGVVVMSALIMLFEMIDSKASILKPDVKQGSLLYEPVESVVPFIILNLESINLDDPSWEDFKNRVKDTTGDIVNV